MRKFPTTKTDELKVIRDLLALDYEPELIAALLKISLRTYFRRLKELRRFEGMLRYVSA